MSSQIWGRIYEIEEQVKRIETAVAALVAKAEAEVVERDEETRRGPGRPRKDAA